MLTSLLKDMEALRHAGVLYGQLLPSSSWLQLLLLGLLRFLNRPHSKGMTRSTLFRRVEKEGNVTTKEHGLRFPTFPGLEG
jgi:hypothetical protein